MQVECYYMDPLTGLPVDKSNPVSPSGPHGLGITSGIFLDNTYTPKGRLLASADAILVRVQRKSPHSSYWYDANCIFNVDSDVSSGAGFDASFVYGDRDYLSFVTNSAAHQSIPAYSQPAIADVDYPGFTTETSGHFRIQVVALWGCDRWWIRHNTGEIKGQHEDGGTQNGLSANNKLRFNQIFCPNNRSLYDYKYLRIQPYCKIPNAKKDTWQRNSWAYGNTNPHTSGTRAGYMKGGRAGGAEGDYVGTETGHRFARRRPTHVCDGVLPADWPENNGVTSTELVNMKLEIVGIPHGAEGCETWLFEPSTGSLIDEGDVPATITLNTVIVTALNSIVSPSGRPLSSYDAVFCHIEIQNNTYKHWMIWGEDELTYRRHTGNRGRGTNAAVVDGDNSYFCVRSGNDGLYNGVNSGGGMYEPDGDSAGGLANNEPIRIRVYAFDTTND